MANLGRLHSTLARLNGTPAVGATVEVRRQGATVTANQSGTSPFQVTVADVGGIQAGDTVAVGIGATTYNVDSIDTSNLLTISGFVGTLALLTGDRLTPTNALPTLYADEQAVNTLPGGNPMTTDDRGTFDACVDSSPYDLRVSGGGYGDRLIVDVWPAGIATVRIYAQKQGVGYIFDVKNLPAGSRIISFEVDGVEKFGINADGTITGTVSVSVPDPLTLTNGLTVNGVTTLNNGCGVLGGLTCDNFTGTGTFAVAAGAIATAALANHAVTVAPSSTLGGSTDVNMTTSDAVLATVGYTPAGTNSVLLILVNAGYFETYNDGQSAFGTLTLFVDGVAQYLVRFGANNSVATTPTQDRWLPVALTFVVTGLSNASHTIEVRHKKTDVDGTGGTITYKGTIQRAHLDIVEFKK